MQDFFSSSYFIDFLKVRFKELLGLCLFAIVLLLIGSLLTYHFDDPSFNTASLQEPANFFQVFGSCIGDLCYQIFGFPAVLLCFIMGCWGYRLLSATNFKLTTLKILGALTGVIAFGFTITAIPYLSDLFLKSFKVGEHLPHSGGFLSYLFYAKVLSLLKLYHCEVIILPLVFFVFTSAFLLIWFTCGFTFEQLFKCFFWLYRCITLVCAYVGKLFYDFYMVLHKSYKKKTYYDLPHCENQDQSRSASHIIFENVEDSPDFEWTHGKSLEPEEQNAEILQNGGAKKRTVVKNSVVQIPSHLILEDGYTLPPLELLDKTNVQKQNFVSDDALKEQARMLEMILNEFGIHGEIVNIRPGPVVTMYELKPAPGTKTSRIISLADDIARSMSAFSARIAVIQGQNVVGIELPNKKRQTVFLKTLLETHEYKSSETNLPLILGQDIGGQAVIADLSKMPHLLVAGTTGSGKSVSVNAMILSILFKLSPTLCKFIMIDPKMLELSVYDDIPHLLTPVVTDPKKAVVALKWAVKEMENRYRAMSKLGVRNISGFNNRLKDAKQNGEILVRRVQTGFDPDTGKPIFENQDLDFEPFPYIIVVVDEMADLMLVAGKEIEVTIQRLAQMARAAGIHLIMATQRPSVDVITGTIKANFPTRISFQVTSKIDSRTILSEQGAEQLLGQGDMLYMAGGGRISRIHGPFVKDDEVERIVSFLKMQGEPHYVDGVTDDDEILGGSAPGQSESKEDATYNAALEVIMREGKVSTSFIQRHLQIGYNKAARIVEQMEKDGIISPPNHVGKREILKS